MNTKLSLWSLSLLMGFILLIAGCSNNSPTNPYGGGGGNGGGGGGNSSSTVTMGSTSFNPQNLTVTRGTTVTWSNTSSIAHTSTSDNGAWDTGNIPAGSSKTTTFNTTGTFPYHCTYHKSMGMVGTITVQ